MIAELKNIIIEHGLEYFGRYYSFYRGEIVSNEDPKFLGRLKIKVPEVYGEDVPEYWAWPKGMPSGKNIGLFAIPSVGDGVWVAFENGDPRFPVWEYGNFRENEVPEDAKVDGIKPNNFILQSKSGHKIELDDKNELIRIKDKHGNIIELNSEGVSIISEKISLGTLNGSEEPAVLGDTLHELLKEFFNDIGSLETIVTSNGVTDAIQTAANWGTVKSKWESKWEDFKSEKVSLDS